MIDTMAYIARARAGRSMGLPSPPRFMTWNVTNRCNAKCSMCEIHSWASRASDELSAEKLSIILSDRMLRGLEVVRITGGEPFLRDDLAQLRDVIAEKTACKILYITTNGSFPDRLADFVAHAAGEEKGRGPKLHIQVSLDALDETHDKLRGVSGMGEKAAHSIETLARLRKRYNFYAGINQTVMKETLRHIGAVAEYAERLGVGHHLFLGAEFHEGKTMAGISPDGGALSFSPAGGMSDEELLSFYAAHEEAKGRARAAGNGVLSAYLRDLSEEYLNEGGRNRAMEGRVWPRPPCMAMFTHFRMFPGGEIASCSVYRDLIVGNASEKPFTKIWNGTDAAKIRRKVKACAGCWIECDINPSVFYSGDIIKWYLSKAVKDPRFRKNYLPLPF